MIIKEIYDINYLMKMTGVKSYSELQKKGYMVDEYLLNIYWKLNDKINELKEFRDQVDTELNKIYKHYILSNIDKENYNDESNIDCDKDIYKTRIVNLKPIYDLKMLIDKIQKDSDCEDEKISYLDLIELNYDIIGYLKKIKKQIEIDLDKFVLNLNEIKQHLDECNIDPFKDEYDI